MDRIQFVTLHLAEVQVAVPQMICVRILDTVSGTLACGIEEAVLTLLSERLHAQNTASMVCCKIGIQSIAVHHIDMIRASG